MIFIDPPLSLAACLTHKTSPPENADRFLGEEAVTQPELAKITRALRVPFGLVTDETSHTIGVHLDARSLAALGIHQRSYYLMDAAAPCFFTPVQDEEDFVSSEEFYVRDEGRFCRVDYQSVVTGEVQGPIYRKTRIPRHGRFTPEGF